MSRARLLAPPLLLAGLASTSGHAAVLCVRRNGAILLRERCRPKETVLQLDQIGAFGPTGPPGAPGALGPRGPQGVLGAPGVDGSPDTPDQVRGKFFTGDACPGNDATDVMVRVGSICVDIYEASIWSARTGGTRYDESTQYGCGNRADDCTGIFARSVKGVFPARDVSWFQAQQACANSGKRLLTNAEWQMAAAGTPDPGQAGDGITACNTASEVNFGQYTVTGNSASCVSNAGVHDMVGNVWEWVADWIPQATVGNQCFGWDTYSDDLACLTGTNPTMRPGALMRGGGFRAGTLAGTLAISGLDDPSARHDDLGFRCAR